MVSNRRYKMVKSMVSLSAAVVAAVSFADGAGVRVGALDAQAWDCSKWISAKDAPVFEG